MKIVIDARISGTSTGRYVDKLIEYLAKLPVDHEFVVLTKTHRLDYLKGIAPTFKVVESNFKEFTFSEQLGFLKQLRSLKADLVHFPMVQQPLLYWRPTVTSMLDLTTTRFKNSSKNSVVFNTKQLVYKILNRIVANRSKHIITITNYVKKDLQKSYHIKDNRITTTHCASDKIDSPPGESIHLKGIPFIMYVGRPQPHKNLGRLIDAFNILHKKYPELRLVLAGQKDTLFEQHEKRAIELGLNRSPISDLRTPTKNDSVVFTGFVSEGQLRWLYENCQAYVFPSLSEGFGLPGLEAMVHGAPVVSSNATCLPEVYGNAAHYFSPYSTKEMAEKIDDVLSNKTLRSTLIKRGREQAKKYSWARMAKQTLEIYNRVLDQ